MRKVLAVALCLLLCGGCAAQTQMTTETTLSFMDTVSIITLPASQASAAKQVFALCEALDVRWAARRADSEIGQLNAAQGAFVLLSEDTLAMLERAQGYAALSEGMLDVTIAPASLLWQFTASEPVLPEAQALADALARVGIENLHLEAEGASLSQGAEIDLGALAKGAALDQSIALLRDLGVKTAIVNLGGSVYALGSKPDGSAWRVGIQRPFEGSEAYLGVVAVRDLCVVTAGIYQRCFELDGTLYHHILNPETGMPCDTDLASASIIYSEGLAADAYSTICVLLGAEKALALVEAVPDMECILVLKDGSLRTSSGIGTRIPFEEAQP